MLKRLSGGPVEDPVRLPLIELLESLQDDYGNRNHGGNDGLQLDQASTGTAPPRMSCAVLIRLYAFWHTMLFLSYQPSWSSGRLQAGSFVELVDIPISGLSFVHQQGILAISRTALAFKDSCRTVIVWILTSFVNVLGRPFL